MAWHSGTFGIPQAFMKHTFITKLSLNNSETGMREGCRLAFAY